MNSQKEISIIGGGAAGFFAAINCAAMYPQHRITIFEKSHKLLAKVRVSGGGRCNVTHACTENNVLAANYPRGSKQLLSAFSRFSVADTIQWFEARGVKLKTEEDGRMFPASDSSQTIIDCFLQEAEKYNVKIHLNATITGVSRTNDEKINLAFQNAETKLTDCALVAAGGSPSAKGFEWLGETGHTIILPVPSLFTFNIPGNPITELMGVSAEHVRVKIKGTNFFEEGPLLITHWGMSGPAILKLSSRAARTLAVLNYHFSIQINWLGNVEEDELRSHLNEFKKTFSPKLIKVQNPFSLPKRLWEYFLTKIKCSDDLKWAHISKEQLNKIVRVLLYDEYEVRGKTTFKEEFVTCGGVALDEIDFKTMESKKMKGLYFAGEVLDIDAVTGGFNFQAAWTSGFIAAMAMGQ